MKTLLAFPTRTRMRAFVALAVGTTLLIPATHALDITVAPGGNIQSAIDQVNASGGGTVKLRAGTHTINAALLMRSNVTLKGAGAGSTTIQNTGASANYSLVIKPTAALSNVTVRDLSLDGRHSAGGNGLFFEGDNTTNLQLINLEVRNTTHQGIHPKGIIGLTQSNNYVHDSGSIPLCHNQYVRRATNVNVSGCRFDSSPAGDGAKFTLWTGAVVTNCTATGNFNRGLRTQDVNTDGSFTYNTVVGQRWDGIEIFANNTLLANNVAFNNGLDTASANRNGIHTFGGSGTVRDNHSFDNPFNYALGGSFTKINNLTTPPSFSLIQAENYSAMAGIKVETCADAGGGQDVGFTQNNDFLAYHAVNLTGVSALSVRAASDTEGGRVEIHLDSVTGPRAGTVTVTNTGGWQSWTTKTGRIYGASGTRNVYLVFKGKPGYLLNINWLQFK